MATSSANYSSKKSNSYQESFVDSKHEVEADSDVFFEELEDIKRLERDKKIKRKKVKEEDVDDKAKKLYGKQRKIKNIDWTRGYEQGLFEDDEFYNDYMR